MTPTKKPKRAGATRRSSPAKARTKAPKAPRRAKGTTGTGRKPVPSRADLGAPIDAFFTRQPPHLRAILEALRALVEEAAPDARSSIKWGMPFFGIGREMMCALAAFKAHVNLILAGPSGTFEDPEALLEGEGKTGRHLKLRALDELPREAVRGWLRAAASIARAKGAER